MSHFVVMVIGEDPEKLLEPFDENLEVEPYVYNGVTEEDKQSFLNYYEKNYQPFNELKEKYGDDLFEELYKIKGKEWDGNSLTKDKDGQWVEMSSRNPNAKWDWYSLGGRWSGRIKLKPNCDGKYGTPGVFDNEVGIDQARKGDIENIQEITCRAVIKDGKWYEKGQMGWWGISFNDKDQDEWNNEVKKLLEEVPDDTLISMYDCHI